MSQRWYITHLTRAMFDIQNYCRSTFDISNFHQKLFLRLTPIDPPYFLKLSSRIMSAFHLQFVSTFSALARPRHSQILNAYLSRRPTTDQILIYVLIKHPNKQFSGNRLRLKIQNIFWPEKAHAFQYIYNKQNIKSDWCSPYSGEIFFNLRNK